MSELHMGLIGLGALGVLGVVVYNAWVAYRHRRLAGRLLDPLEKDALFDTQAAPPAPPGLAPETETAAEPASEWEDAAEDVPELSPASPETASAPGMFMHTDEDDAKDEPESADDQEAEVAAEMTAPPASAAEAVSASASFAAAASRWLSALHLSRSGGEVSSSEAEASVRERIEPALGHAAADIAGEDGGSEADFPAIDDSGEFGEILESRPYGESGQAGAAPLSTGHGYTEDVELMEYTEHAEHTAAKSAHAAPAARGASVPVHETAFESGRGSTAVPDASAREAASVAANAVDAAAPDDQLAEGGPAGVGEPMHLLSPAIDYIATLETAAGVPAADWLAAQRATLSRADKPVHWAGFDEENGEWVMLGADAARGGESRLFRHVRAGLQLADRRGALSENDLLIFATAMDALAREWQAQGRPVMLDLPDPRPVPAVAADLDAFCAGVDIQISLNVIALNEAFPGTQVRALAESAGMFLDAHGRFVRVSDDGSVLYMLLLNHDPAGFSAENLRATTVQGLTFLFDVPTVARGERVFDQLAELAGRFADVLKGALVDDNRRPLSEASLAPISRQIAQFQASMAQRNLPAGGRMARRLFS